MHVDLAPWQSMTALWWLARRNPVFVTCHTALTRHSWWREWLWRLKFGVLTRCHRFRILASNQDARAESRALPAGGRPGRGGGHLHRGQPGRDRRRACRAPGRRGPARTVGAAATAVSRGLCRSVHRPQGPVAVSRRRPRDRGPSVTTSASCGWRIPRSAAPISTASHHYGLGTAFRLLTAADLGADHREVYRLLAHGRRLLPADLGRRTADRAARGDGRRPAGHLDAGLCHSRSHHGRRHRLARGGRRRRGSGASPDRPEGRPAARRASGRAWTGARVDPVRRTGRRPSSPGAPTPRRPAGSRASGRHRRFSPGRDGAGSERRGPDLGFDPGIGLARPCSSDTRGSHPSTCRSRLLSELRPRTPCGPGTWRFDDVDAGDASDDVGQMVDGHHAILARG